MANEFRGVLPALFTPYDEKGRFDPDALHRLVEFVLGKGVYGGYVGGSTGEGLLLSVEERKQLTKTAVEAFNGRGKVIIHVGTLNTRDAAEIAAHAAEVGADAVSSIPPIYYKYGPDEIHDYYREIGRAAGIPLFLYSIPKLVGMSFGADDLKRFRDIPQFKGIKFTDQNLFELRNIREDFGEDFVIFNGFDELLACGLMMGASGGIGTMYNYMPELFVGIYRAVEGDSCRKAFDLQYKVNRVIRLNLHYKGLSGAKAIMKMRGVDCGCAREPLSRLSAEEESEFRKALEGLDFFGSYLEV